MKKWNYDLGHFSFQVGQIGSLQTLSTIPVIAGDSMALDLTGVFRLSPLRRNLTVDAKVDIFAFYIPYRHIYGDDWIDFIKQGVDETVIFDTVNLGGANFYSCYGAPYIGVVPKWLVTGYNRIWNRYFRHPTDVLSEKTDTDISTLDANYGYETAYLPTIWNTPIDATVDSSDYEVASATVVSLLDIAQQQARLKTERRRDFYSVRYNDVLARTFGSGVNIDADERPELVMRSPAWLSGYDVDGTADATLGTYSGKAAGIMSMRIPKKFFPEHGTLWIMAAVRFPPVHENEAHYLTQVTQPTYAEIAGDPDVLAKEPPHIVDLNNHFVSGGHLADAGQAPFGQWYRQHPSNVHWLYRGVTGFSFISGTLTTKNNTRYIVRSEYDDVFQNTSLGHWQCQTRIECHAARTVPPVEASIFAGSD